MQTLSIFTGIVLNANDCLGSTRGQNETRLVCESDKSNKTEHNFICTYIVLIISMVLKDQV